MNNLRIKKSEVVIVIISAIFASIITNLPSHLSLMLSSTFLVVLVVLWSFIFIAAMIWAGSIVIKALFDVAVGLSLTIFLVQAYCGPMVMRTAASDQALKALVFLGLAYVSYDFLVRIYRGSKELLQSVKEVDGKWSTGSVLLCGLILLFIAAFALLIYQVMTPIVTSFCIYN
jgi:hypothetical protein